MKDYKGFFKLLGDGAKEGLALIGRGLLILVYIFVFMLWILATGVERGFEKLIKLINKANHKLKSIEVK